jgi:hypothetical protein
MALEVEKLCMSTACPIIAIATECQQQLMQALMQWMMILVWDVQAWFNSFCLNIVWICNMDGSARLEHSQCLLLHLWTSMYDSCGQKQIA